MKLRLKKRKGAIIVKKEQRKVDQLGRIMLPFEIREMAKIKKMDLLDIEVKDEKIVITKA
jgi:AbrB family looped-hinge helix DNA binding protein